MTRWFDHGLYDHGHIAAPPAITPMPIALVRDVSARAADARGLLGRHVTQARQMLRRLLDGRLVCERLDVADGRGYAFTATGTYRRLLSAGESVNVGGGPNGICTLVGQGFRFEIRGIAFR
jgi:hypothetical protein